MSALHRIPSDRRHGIRKQGPAPLVVAAVTIALAVAVTLWAFNGKQLPFTHSFTVHALVRNSVDIVAGSPVRIAGVDVGQVTGTSADGTLTKIAFTVQSNGLPLHTDATLTIRDRLFLEGAYYLQLNPGTPAAPIAGDGYTIPVSNTAYPVQFYELLSTFDNPVRTSLEQTLQTLEQGFSPQQFTGGGQPTSTSGAAGLKATAPQLAPVLTDVAWISQGLHGTTPGDVERLLSSSSDVTTTLQSAAPQLADFLTSLNRVSGALASSDGAVSQSISGLDRTLQIAPPTLTALDHSLPPLSTLSIALDPSLKSTPPLLGALIKAVDELAAVLSPAERPRLLDVLKTTFQKLPSTLSKLGGAFATTRPVTDCLRTHVIPILNTEVPDDSLSTGQPMWKDFAHTLDELSSGVQNFDGNGYWMRMGAATDVGISTGTLPGIGNVLALTPSSEGVLGVRPQWDGPLTPSDFRPDVSCSTQPVPNLAAPTGKSDFARTNARGTPLSVSQMGLLARAFGLSAPTKAARGASRR